MRRPSIKTRSSVGFAAHTKLFDGGVVSDEALPHVMPELRIWIQMLAAVGVVAFMMALTSAIALVVLLE